MEQNLVKKNKKNTKKVTSIYLLLLANQRSLAEGKRSTLSFAKKVELFIYNKV